jgi:predicted Rossmann fold nucleotide-binding protein DprA/Smf involved in DNA uptake
MPNHVLPPDTQAILLLCASFGQKRQTQPQPLTLSEYNSLAEWLLKNKMRPADLLAPTIAENYSGKLDTQRLLALLQRGAMLSLAVEKWTNQGLWILGRSDANYPKRLKKILKHLAPPILYGVGNIELLSMGGLAIVGSRDIDEEGLNYTQKIAQTCSAQSIQVISGGARGVDQAAMFAALNAGGTSVGVLADSLASSAVNSKYRPHIKDGKLLLVSNYDPEAGFSTGNAMGRNKYIYALGDYTLVINSSVGKGGTWAGATEVLSKFTDIPVFVRLDDTPSPGNQELYKKGAKPFPPEPWNSLKELLVTNSSSSQTPTQLSFL